jgi:hypothetical protein
MGVEEEAGGFGRESIACPGVGRKKNAVKKQRNVRLKE